MTILVGPHPLLDLQAFEVEIADGIGESPAWLVELLRLEASGALETAGDSSTSKVPLTSSDEVRAQVRDVLRVGGFKPTGRSKPASEYLLRTAGEGTLGSINPLVDACNVVSLHSGLPISIVDADRVVGQLRVAIADPGASYVFNASGQVIDVAGLVCLADDEGPCANAVKDSQRTKTSDQTRKAVVVVWGALAASPRAERAAAWYRELLGRMGMASKDVMLIKV